MKKTFLLLIILILSGCSLTPETKISGSGTGYTPSVNLSSLTSSLPQDISTDTAFLTCSSAAVDMCLQESRYDAGKEVSCDNYLLEENKASCERNKVISAAKTAGDVNLCETLGTGKEACIYEVISMKALTSKDETLCTGLGDSFSIQCHNKIVTAKALERLDAKLCETLKTQENDTLVKEMCQDEVAYNIGLQEKK